MIHVCSVGRLTHNYDMARKAEINADGSAVDAFVSIDKFIYDCGWMCFHAFLFSPVCMSVFKISLLGSVVRWASPSHIKSLTPAKGGIPCYSRWGCNNIDPGTHFIYSVCVCVYVYVYEWEWERQKMMHSSWNPFWQFNIHHPEYSSPPFFRFISVSNIRNTHLESTPFLPAWLSAQSI